MSRRAVELAILLSVLGAGAVCAQPPWRDLGRAATPAEIAAWDIDVRPDFKGLPPGSGSVDQGQEIWEARCASCHGVFGESNEVFTPIAGGTTAEDMQTGRVAALRRSEARTTLMKLPTLSSLWDYINRAMPWDAPKSLSTDEVYAVTAYILNLGDIVPADFVLSDRNMQTVQDQLPNRNGMTTEHGLWHLSGRPDVQNVACMRDCVERVEIASSLPDHARDAHGNLAAQHRLIGPVRGADTTRPPAASMEEAKRLALAAADQALQPDAMQQEEEPAAALAVADREGCMACHAVDRKLLGPAFRDVAQKYAAHPDGAGYLARKIKTGGAGVWGQVPMPPQPNLSDEDAQMIVQWLLSAAK